MQDTSPTRFTTRPEDAFICVSRWLGTEWTSEAYRVVTNLGLTPFFYQGLEKAYEGSPVSNEAHRDLWDSDVIIVAINEKEAQNPSALWVYNDIEVAARRALRCFVYAQSAPSAGALARWRRDVPVRCVADAKQFGERVREDLTRKGYVR